MAKPAPWSRAGRYWRLRSGLPVQSLAPASGAGVRHRVLSLGLSPSHHRHGPLARALPRTESHSRRSAIFRDRHPHSGANRRGAIGLRWACGRSDRGRWAELWVRSWPCARCGGQEWPGQARKPSAGGKHISAVDRNPWSGAEAFLGSAHNLPASKSCIFGSVPTFMRWLSGRKNMRKDIPWVLAGLHSCSSG